MKKTPWYIRALPLIYIADNPKHDQMSKEIKDRVVKEFCKK
jgi:hypothetical protein